MNETPGEVIALEIFILVKNSSMKMHCQLLFSYAREKMRPSVLFVKEVLYSKLSSSEKHEIFHKHSFELEKFKFVKREKESFSIPVCPIH